MRLHHVVFAALLAHAPAVAQAQDGVMSPRDAASGVATVVVKASNTQQVTLNDIVVSSVSRATGRRQYEPMYLKMTLPAGSATREFKSESTTQMIWTNDTIDKLEVLLRLAHGGSACSARATAQYEPSAKRWAIMLGDVAMLFDSQGKPIAAKCSEQ